MSYSFKTNLNKTDAIKLEALNIFENESIHGLETQLFELSSFFVNLLFKSTISGYEFVKYDSNNFEIRFVVDDMVNIVEILKNKEDSSSDV